MTRVTNQRLLPPPGRPALLVLPTYSSKFQCLLYAGLAAAAATSPFHRRQDGVEAYSLPTGAEDCNRTAEIEVKREGWLYGPSIAGNTSFYPAGTLGAPAAEAQLKDLENFEIIALNNATSDAQLAGAAIVGAGGLTSLDSYSVLYENQWLVSVPDGPFPGVLANYTSDLLFSMEQLSLNPYRVKRVSAEDSLVFSVENAEDITGATLEVLQAEGRLFLSDFSDQNLPREEGKYGGASQGYFYIDSDSGNFLPLAIKTNAEDTPGLVYTPADNSTDWLLAKMVFSTNSVWHAQWYHLAATHEVIDIVYLSAIRTLSDEHPIMAVLTRLAKDTFGIRPIGLEMLFYPGGPIEQVSSWAASEAEAYTDSLYQSGDASSVVSNYFMTNLERRGLINSAFGPALTHFPFYEDASVIYGAIRTFFEALVSSYYPTDDVITADTELQAWIAEGGGPAAIVDWPTSIATADELVDLLAHIAHLVSVVHGTLNTDAPSHASAVLPLHPFAFYGPLPTEKGLADADLLPLLPGVEAALGQIELVAAFNRPSFVDSNMTLSHMFDDAALLGRMNEQVQTAAGVFRDKMDAFSLVVRARTFDEDGLSQGMPFIWKTLDPNTASYWLTI